jgi:hypothetical protein
MAKGRWQPPSTWPAAWWFAGSGRRIHQHQITPEVQVYEQADIHLLSTGGSYIKSRDW